MIILCVVWDQTRCSPTIVFVFFVFHIELDGEKPFSQPKNFTQPAKSHARTFGKYQTQCRYEEEKGEYKERVFLPQVPAEVVVGKA
eukprot:gene19790-1004_t